MRWFVIAIIGLVIAVSAGPTFAQTAADADVKAALEAFQTKPDKKSRKALDAALDAYAGSPTQHTVIAHLTRVSADTQTNRSSKIWASASAAEAHIKPVADQILDQYITVKFLAATSHFNHRQSRDAMIEMAHIEGFLGEELNEADDEVTEWMRPLYYRAMAWKGAMNAYFQSTSKRGPSKAELEDIESMYKPYGQRSKDFTYNRTEDSPVADDDGLAFCSGSLAMKPAIRYSRRAANNMMFGSLILKYGYDQAGRVTDLEVLASIPDEGFKKQARKAVEKWKWVPDPSEQPGVTCRLERSNIILPVVFAMNG